MKNYLNVSASSVKGVLGEEFVQLWWISNLLEHHHCLADNVIGGTATVVIFNATIGEEKFDGWIT